MLNDTLKLFGKRETGFCDFCYMTEDVDIFWLQCIVFQEHWKVLVTALLGKIMIMSVVNLLQNEYFYDLILRYVQKTERGL